MYTVQIRIYEGTDRTRCYGELYEGDPDADDCIMSAHLDVDPLPVTPHFKHLLILKACDAVCAEIAQNLDEALF